MKRYETFTTISKGKFNPSCTRELLAFLAEHNDKRCRVVLEVGSKRSTPQNSYLWGAVYPILRQGFKDSGDELSIEEVHDFCNNRFNYKEIVNESTGEVLKVPTSTTALNKDEFGEYIENIKRFASEYLNTYIPDAGEQMELM